MSKASEIKRLTTPITFKNSKAYDSEGNLIDCVETVSDVRFPIEPDENILDDDEILQYAPQSKAASKIRLKRGFGNSTDLFLVNNSLPWLLALFYIILICIFISLSYAGNTVGMFVILIMAIIPLIYAYIRVNHKFKPEKAEKTTSHDSTAKKNVSVEDGLESLKIYKKEISDLKVLFDVKEEVVRDMIKKRFEPPQITYDKFISLIDSSHKLFYTQYEGAVNIMNLAAEDTPRVRQEIEKKIDAMKSIINQIENLTNELVINISSDDGVSDEVNDLLDQMGGLIDSIKDY